MKKDLFWLTVSEVSVHGQLAPLLWASGKVETSWWEHVAKQSYIPHGSQEVERDREGPRARYS
jgi:hypothetical protein